MNTLYKLVSKFVLPLSVITQVLHLFNGIWRHHLISNKVGQNRCPLILDNNHCKFSVICVRFMYKYLALLFLFLFLNPTPFVFLKTFLVSTIGATHVISDDIVSYCFYAERPCSISSRSQYKQFNVFYA